MQWVTFPSAEALASASLLPHPVRAHSGGLPEPLCTLGTPLAPEELGHVGSHTKPRSLWGSYIFESPVKDLQLPLGEIRLGLKLLQSFRPVADHGHL